jgi:hypothetical protein
MSGTYYNACSKYVRSGSFTIAASPNHALSDKSHCLGMCVGALALSTFVDVLGSSTKPLAWSWNPAQLLLEPAPGGPRTRQLGQPRRRRLPHLLQCLRQIRPL